jgi:hypothetical protein
VTVRDKVSHVRAAKQTRAHDCHWPGCGKQVPPAMWGCSQHWFKIPRVLRTKLWFAYRAGQEDTFDPSAEYLAVAKEIQAWIVEYLRGKKT